MSKRFLITLITLAVITLGAGIAVFLVKGYTFFPQDGKIIIGGTGIISITSVPDGASVYLDGHLSTATNATISQLTPKTYTVKVIKEGFIPWEKAVKVDQGLVSELKISLFPAIPTVYPLTFNGVVNPVLSPDGTKLAFTVPATEDPQARQKGGIWVWTMASTPISFNRGSGPQQVVVSAPGFDFSKAELKWSADSKQILAKIQMNEAPGDANLRNFLVGIDQRATVADLRDITPTLGTVLKGWEDDTKALNQARVLAITDLGVRKIASDSSALKWSPDESKFIVGTPQPTDTKSQPVVKKSDNLLKGFKVYDLGIDKTARGERDATGQVKVYDLPEALSYLWLPDSRHIIMVQKEEQSPLGYKIEIAEFDGTNRSVIYVGNFNKESVFPWPDSSRLLMVASHPIPTATIPNLFGINLK